jgi:3-deoxy-manno-octulosonate cytidylyltransferase (CMP-KDO synthetase)
MQIVAIIPARYGSTRFPGKALADLSGKPMIQHVYEQTMKASLVSRVIVATDDSRIADVIHQMGGEAIMTKTTHETGTDRLAEVAHGLEADLVINVQGDEPLINPAMIDQAIEPFLHDRSLKMGTLKSRVRCLHDFLSPNVVKVVTDNAGYALYFSRSPLPFFRDKWQDLKDEAFASGRLLCFKHVGLYVYQRNFLLEYAAMPQTFLEISEKLEQLRALENGVRIQVVETEHESLGVDTPEDLNKARERMKQGTPL